MMSQTNDNPAGHLTEDELDDLLIGEGSADHTEHVAGCGLCQQRVAIFESAMGDFNQATLAWAEAKSNTLPSGVAPARARSFAQVWTAAAAVVVAVTLWTGIGLRPATHVDTAYVIERSTPQPVHNHADAGEIARDNDLLAEIDSALDAAVASPLESFDPASIEPTRHTTHSTTQVKN